MRCRSASSCAAARRGASGYVDGGGLIEEPTLDGPESTDAVEGAIVERGEAAEAIALTVAGRLARQPGAALFLDYGPEFSAPGDSLQAIPAGGRPIPRVRRVHADLTAHVDFERFAAAARQAGATVAHGPVPQGLFLARLGLFQRTNQLARGLRRRAPPR